jgi:hypothetical protein
MVENYRMKIEIVLRTHDNINIHKDRQRYCGFDKRTLILGCLSSLINSANLVTTYEVNFKIFDDHSSEEFIKKVHESFKFSRWTYELIPLEVPGHNYSSFRQFEACRDSTADLVYSVEDDYLHCPTALQEMIESYELFVAKSGAEIAIHPFDMPDDYVPPWMAPSWVVHGSRRHWRSGTWSTATIMCRPQVLKDHWPLFEKLALEYTGDYSADTENHVHEGNTINEVWRNHALRFSPIQSLALHMQFDTQLDPYIDWKQWWNDYTKLGNNIQ